MLGKWRACAFAYYNNEGQNHGRREAGDPVSADLFEAIIRDEIAHLNYYTGTTNHIKELGKAFLARHAATSRRTGPVRSLVKVMAKEDF